MSRMQRGNVRRHPFALALWIPTESNAYHLASMGQAVKNLGSVTAL